MRLVLFLTASLLLAATVDIPAARWVHARDLGPRVRVSPVAKVIKWPGDFRFTLVVGAIILAANFQRWRGIVQLLGGGILAGLLYTLVKWSVGRTRPFPRDAPAVPAFEFHPFRHGIRGLKAGNLAFPSGHVCLAFATAFALATMFPRGRIAFFLVAILVGIERVLEGAHYPSDVVGGVIFGWLAARLALASCRCLEREAIGGTPMLS